MTNAVSQPLFPPRIFLSRSPDVTIARPALGLSLYLDNSMVWAQEVTAAVLGSFLRFVSPERVLWYTTSLLSEWRAVDRAGLDQVLRSLSTEWFRGTVRHLFAFDLADDYWAPALGVHYREVDSSREARTGFLQLLLPPDQNPSDLMQLATEIARKYPFWCGVGGYLASWNTADPLTSFDVLHPWCRRYLGLDVQNPDAMAWHVRGGLPGSNWLTLVGASAAKALKLDTADLKMRPWSQGIEVLPLEGGALVRAGAAPTFGDLNELAYPSAYAEVARHLGPHFVSKPPDFPAPRWREQQQTAKWFRRFLEPESWK